MANSDIKAVIYDVDGTMVDSEPLHVAAWDKALQTHGYHLTDLSSEFQATMAGKKANCHCDWHGPGAGPAHFCG